ncbi:MAG: MarC family protein [Terriglobales bacterium]|jgi:multiple antibiotic resistance protein
MFVSNMLIVLKYFGLAFSALLPVVNPLGSALVLLGLVGTAPKKVFHNLARRIAISTTLLLIAVELVGATLLNFFGISLPVVQVAGGFVLAAMGWGLLNEKDAPASTEEASAAEAELDSLDSKIFYPFTFPVTAGPGTIVVMLTLSAHASRTKSLEDVLGHIGIFLAVIALSSTIFLSYRFAPSITQKISPQTVHGILRVIAFILLCIGVQIAWRGLQTLLESVVK